MRKKSGFFLITFSVCFLLQGLFFICAVHTRQPTLQWRWLYDSSGIYSCNTNIYHLHDRMLFNNKKHPHFL